MQLAKDHSAELASQLELLKSRRTDGASGDHAQTAGNSLFGEVDDRRVNIERRMISLKVKHESLERTHATTVLQLKKMKVREELYVVLSLVKVLHQEVVNGRLNMVYCTLELSS